MIVQIIQRSLDQIQHEEQITPKLYCLYIVYGWLVGFSFGLELRSGLLPTVWDSSLKMVRRHAITILILHGENGSLALVPAEE